MINKLLLACALALSSVAAYYSIIGLAAIFSSAFWPVVIMASILELSKLVVASWLYQQWKIVPYLLKAYLTSAVIVLMMITSLGIFGFLSKAHVDQNLDGIDVALKIEQIDTSIAQTRELTQRYQTQLAQLDRSIDIQLDSKRASQALNARKQQNAERTQIRELLDKEQAKLGDLSQQKTALRSQNSIVESKVGPIKYVAELFANGKEVNIDQAVRYMIMMLVAVFDPLAVLMVIAANMSFAKTKKLEEIASPESTQLVQQEVEPTVDQLKWNPELNQMTRFDGSSWVAIHLEQDTAIIPHSHELDRNQLSEIINQELKQFLDEVLQDTVAAESVEESPEISEQAISESTEVFEIVEATSSDDQPTFTEIPQQVEQEPEQVSVELKEDLEPGTVIIGMNKLGPIKKLAE